MHTENLPTRILSTVKLRPMTVREIAAALSVSEERARLSVRQMESSGRLVRAGFAPKVSRLGVTPYLWRAA